MFSLLCSLAFSKKWAVLYIGSNTYSNYRHHSNVDTVFTLLQERGFDTKNIILCQYNDIPNAASNPFKGQIFHSIEHKNVYPGASYITYSGAQVTAQKFYDILSGNDALKSTAEDDVYIYYDNHGGPGILGVPSGNGDYIKEPELVEALAQLEAKNMYRKAFFMIGACYSQSMIKNIKNKNLAIITSANDHESAYACNYDSSVGAYLTNYFNLNFDKLARENPTITLGELFETLKKVITTSETCWGGDESMKSELLSTFIGEANNNRPQILSSKQPCDAAAPLVRRSAPSPRSTSTRRSARKSLRRTGGSTPWPSASRAARAHRRSRGSTSS